MSEANNTFKTCNKCKENKSLFDFPKDKTKKDGRHGSCNSCKRLYAERYRKENKEQVKASDEKYKEKNCEKIKLSKAKYRKENADKIKISKQKSYRKWYSENSEVSRKRNLKWQAENRDKACANAAKYRAKKLKATPSWLTKEDFDRIKEFYEEAKCLQDETGLCYHVDHIIPLQSEEVCGLHVPWNLQVLEAKENISKSNKLVI